jgi:segregation and condensation protein A
MPAAEYMVRLDAFEGPLDLLLFLIRRAEVEISDIPIAQITEQYLRYIEDIADPTGSGHGGRIDIERAGEFLVMAATLMEIKSRMLTPPEQRTGGDGTETTEGGEHAGRKAPIDPRAELVKQLMEYKRYRDAGDTLNRFKKEWEDMFPAGRALAPKPEVEAVAEEQTGPVDLEDIELIDLVQAFGRIIETVDLTRVGEHRVAMDDTPIELHAEDIVDRLKRRAEETLAAGLEGGGVAELDFVTVFENRSRSEMIGLFLAVLELVKQQRVWVRQQDDDRSGKRIVLRLAETAADASAAPPTAAPVAADEANT